MTKKIQAEQKQRQKRNRQGHRKTYLDQGLKSTKRETETMTDTETKGRQKQE